jgi:hypothetical protein
MAMTQNFKFMSDEFNVDRIYIQVLSSSQHFVTYLICK